jgi:hypothetical protein
MLAGAEKTDRLYGYREAVLKGLLLENHERRVRVPVGWPEPKADAREVLREALGNAADDRRENTLTEQTPAGDFYRSEEQWGAVLKSHLRR